MSAEAITADRGSAFSCGHCGASLSFDGVRTETCPYCTSPNFVERPASMDQPQPAFVLPFTGGDEAARGWLARWIRRHRWFADPALARATIADAKAIYLPAYLYSAVARTDYTASIGEHYTETEEVKTTDKHGMPSIEKRTITRTEYRPLSGHHLGYVTDVVVSASAGLPNAELGAIEPFDLQRLHRFHPALIAGWTTEEFSRSADACRRESRADAIDEVGTRLRRFMPGDSHNDLEWRTRVDWESLDPILVPVWVLAVRYRDDKDPVRVVINGQTGTATGRVPLSWWKITLAIAMVCALAALAYVIYRAVQP